MKKILILLSIVTLLMNGCVIVEPEGHCPPGQAKKGRC